MSIRDAHQLKTTREKLALLQESANQLRGDLSQDEHLKELTLRSLKQLINQFKEEIARFEATVDSTQASATSSRSI